MSRELVDADQAQQRRLDPHLGAHNHSAVGQVHRAADLRIAVERLLSSRGRNAGRTGCSGQAIPGRSVAAGSGREGGSTLGVTRSGSLSSAVDDQSDHDQ